MTDMTRSKITAAEFFELPEQPGFPIVELIDGEIIMSASPIPKHQRISLRLALILDTLKPNGEVFTAPLDVHLDDSNVLEPDIMWISAHESSAIIGERHIIGAPDLVVEVFSPSTLKRDKTQKFTLYEKHGVREYWMVDLETEQVEVWANSAKGFERVGVVGKSGTFTSPALGKPVDLTPVFA